MRRTIYFSDLFHVQTKHTEIFFPLKHIAKTSVISEKNMRRTGSILHKHYLKRNIYLYSGSLKRRSHEKAVEKHLSFTEMYALHDDVIKWKHFPRNWPFVREIHRSPVNFPHKGQWRGPLMFSLIYAWINDWVNNREAGDLRRQHGHYDVIVMTWSNVYGTWYICPTTPYFVNRPQF